MSTITFLQPVVANDVKPLAEHRAGYMPYLDGLRGIAITLVLILHAGVPYVRGGWVGVDIFFVLSGFLITSLLMREQDERGFINLKHFYIRRALRLIPAVVVVLVVFLLVSAIAFNDFSQRLHSAGFVFFYVANWVRALDPAQLSKEISHCWSLSVEEQFYLIWPPIFIVMARLKFSYRAMAGIALAGALACAIWRAYLQWDGATVGRLYFSFDTRFDAMLLGCALALAESFIRPGRWLTPATIASLTLIIYICFPVRFFAPWMFNGGYTLVALASCVLIVHLRSVASSPLRRLTTWSPLVGLGRISYGVYLWHFVIMVWLEPFVWQDPYRRFGWVLSLVIGGGLSILIAMQSYKWIEKRFLKLKPR